MIDVLSILEIFWSPLWELQSINIKLKIERIVDTILDAILIDFRAEPAWDRGDIGVGSAEWRGLLEA